MKVRTSYRIKKGVLLLLLTAVLWSLGGLWVKFIDWDPVAIAGARSLVAFLVIAALMPQALSRLSWSAVPGALAYASVMFLFVLATKLTTAASLAHGVPMIAIPIAFDQPGVGARLLRTDTGKAIPVHKLNSCRLRLAIAEVLGTAPVGIWTRSFRR
jgi:hypothetical protein